MNIRPVRTRLFKENENLVAFIRAHISRLKEGSVLAVTSKIVALAEGRVAPAGDAQAKEILIRSESEWAVPTKHVFVTLRDGMLTANAGIDASNAREGFVLLPRDAMRSATRLLTALKRAYRVKKLGVILTDSRTMPLRSGVTAVAVGYAGIKGLRDYRGKRDLYGRPFKFTRVNVADSLATAAAFEMGEGAERQPLAVIEEASIAFGTPPKNELRIAPADDMYGPFIPDPARRRGRKR